MFDLVTTATSPLSIATYDPVTGEMYLEFDYDKLLDIFGEWRDARHIDAVTLDGTAYPIIIHDDDGPRDETGAYIFDRETVDNIFTLDIGTGRDPADGTLDFGLTDREDGTGLLYEFELQEVETTGDGPSLVAAINVGGDAYTSQNGILYEADMSDDVRSYTNTGAIAGTEDDALYQTKAWQTGGFEYDIPVENGTYQLELNFAEIWNGADAAGDRVFDLYVEDELVFDNLDVRDAAGMRTAFDLVGEVVVEDGALTIATTSEVQNPMLAGLSIWQGAADLAEGFTEGSIAEDYLV